VCVCLKLYILVYDKLTDHEYLWTKAKFLNRQSYMQDMYGTFELTGTVPDIPQVTELKIVIVDFLSRLFSTLGLCVLF